MTTFEQRQKKCIISIIFTKKTLNLKNMANFWLKVLILKKKPFFYAIFLVISRKRARFLRIINMITTWLFLVETL